MKNIYTYLFLVTIVLLAACKREEEKVLPKKPEKIVIEKEGARLFYNDEVVFEAIGSPESEYEWSVTGPSEWGIRESSKIIFTHAPEVFGIYTVKVASKNKYGISEYCSATLEVYDPGAEVEIPQQPGFIQCSHSLSNLQSDSIVTFFIAPVFSAVSYQWRISGPESWNIPDTTTSVSVRIPKTKGKYTVSVSAKNEKGLGPESVLEIEITERMILPKEVVDLIEGVDLFPELTEYNQTSVIDERSYNEEENVEGTPHLTVWNCVTKRYSISENPDDYFMFNPLASVLWPGNIIQGKTISSGVPTNIPISKRKPGTVTLAIASSDQSGAINQYYRTVDKIQFSSITQAMNEILSGYNGNGYAKYIFEMDFIENAKDLSLKLNVGYKGPLAKTDNVFDINWSSDKTRILVKLHQQYFTMIYDDPDGVNGMFTPDLTVDEIRNYTGAGNPICYISSVTYGKVYFLVYESSASKKDLEAALKFSFKNLNSISENKYHEVMSQTQVKAVQVGGNAEDGLILATTPDVDKIQDFLAKGANFSSQNIGAPISYTIKYLKNAQLVRMNNAMQYDVENCEPVKTTTLKDNFGITLNSNTVQVIHSDTYAGCEHYIGIDVGNINNHTGFTEILQSFPENSGLKYIGNSKNANYKIDFKASSIPMLRDNTLFIRFRFYNNTIRKTTNWLGIPTEHKGDGTYEKTIYFDFDPEKQKWIPREDQENYARLKVGSPNINTFFISNTLQYSITVN